MDEDTPTAATANTPKSKRDEEEEDEDDNSSLLTQSDEEGEGVAHSQDDLEEDNEPHTTQDGKHFSLGTLS